MPKREITAIFLVTQNVDGLVPFYRDTLGLTLTRHEPGHSAWFEAGPVPLVLHTPEPEESETVDYTPAKSDPSPMPQPSRPERYRLTVL